ncbi:MAG: PAS domain-containing protein [Desulfurella sp.]|uniref:PAS domain-containing protein n=1 Tax=Desulfurella sp. TaxID=1962857 RepID=UPI003D138259
MSQNCQILEAIFNGVGDGILFCDVDGIIKLWSRGCEKIFGYSSSEAIGQSLDIIIPEKYRKRHWDGFFSAIKSKSSKYSDDLLSVPAIGKNNKSLSIDFSIAIVEQDSKLLGFGAIIRDATKSFLEKKQLKNEIEELKNKLKQFKEDV